MVLFVLEPITEIPRSINELYIKNVLRIQALTQLTKITQRELAEDAEKSWEMGAAYMKETFGPIRYKLFVRSQVARYKSFYRPTPVEVEKRKYAKALLDQNFAMILIRPEMLHVARELLLFLQNMGIHHYWDENVVVDKDMYWTLCSDAITKFAARKSMPTRTLVYLHSPCKLAFLYPTRRDDLKIEGTTFADTMCHVFKGTAGKYQHGTVRGDFVYQEAKRLEFHTLENPKVALAADPFHAYRHLVSERQMADPDALLAFTAVSVHVPDSTEMERDLLALLDIDRLRFIKHALLSNG